MVEVAKLIRRHLHHLLTYLQHGITNAGVKALTATIQWVKKPASATWNSSRPQSISSVEDLISTHTKAGKARK